MATNVIFFLILLLLETQSCRKPVSHGQIVCLSNPSLAFSPEALCGLIACVEGTDISLELIYKQQQQFTACFLTITKLFSISCIMMFYLKEAQYFKCLSNMSGFIVCAYTVNMDTVAVIAVTLQHKSKLMWTLILIYYWCELKVKDHTWSYQVNFGKY